MTINYVGYAGTYTRKTSKGVYRFELDPQSQKLTAVEVAAEVGSPTYVTISDDKRYLFSIAQDGESGGVQAYKIDPKTGKLTKLDEQLTEGKSPCHLSFYKGKLVTGNYHKGEVGLYSFTAEETLVAESFIQHSGSGPHERQEKSHVHFAGFTPERNYVVVCDLGTDELVTYRIAGNQLERHQTLTLKLGSGPRHIVFHPNGKTAYLLTELSSEVIVIDYHAETGSFTEKQTILAKPADFTDTNDASAIHISSDGKFVYTGNRGHNSIALFEVDPKTDKLTFVEFTSTGGEWPRDFVLDPSESFIVASNQHSGNLVLFARDQQTGKLTQLDSVVEVPEVVCVKFLN
ncbi:MULTISPECIES: lactonase family protein [unclassified Virgibacillus]|uniref:lactonase family protein n=1 Tax=unclassified Virgibacillus TaxID=2620237 RepID=UPI00090A8493|nr:MULTISPECIES: lactonase family protein [unclassified Virgibacillus]API93276.1 6-phosphogluconolactonase [Virgibacillus sp. 6R]MBS7428678.1 lactonase family protein [Virgibacillus sp. 19R1-5]